MQPFSKIWVNILITIELAEQVALIARNPLIATEEYYRRRKQAELKQAQREHDWLTRRLEHGKPLILEAWQDEERPLEETEVWEDLWIALWREQRGLSRIIKASSVSNLARRVVRRA